MVLDLPLWRRFGCGLKILEGPSLFKLWQTADALQGGAHAEVWGSELHGGVLAEHFGRPVGREHSRVTGSFEGIWGFLWRHAALWGLWGEDAARTGHTCMGKWGVVSVWLWESLYDNFLENHAIRNNVGLQGELLKKL